MNLVQLMHFQPRLGHVESGPEHSLTFMVAYYYLRKGFTEEEVSVLVAKYFGALGKAIEK
ncbi:MAG: hypothetical protein ACXW1D_00295 [Halobacteriota archaeon]